MSSVFRCSVFERWLIFSFFSFFWANNSPHKSPETWLESENEFHTELNFHFVPPTQYFFFFLEDDSFQDRATIHIFCVGYCSDLCHSVLCLTLGASSLPGDQQQCRLTESIDGSLGSGFSLQLRIRGLDGRRKILITLNLGVCVWVCFGGRKVTSAYGRNKSKSHRMIFSQAQWTQTMAVISSY